VSEPQWLAARGIGAPQQAGVIRAARALQLYAVRRAALGVLLHAETTGLTDQDAKAAAVALEARALGVKVAPEEGGAFRIELDDGLRSATYLKAALAAADQRERLQERFWVSPDAGRELLGRWSSGTSEELAVSPGAAEALVRTLGGGAQSHSVSPVPDAGLLGPGDGGTPR
jgi:hypothetical protein